MKKQNVNNTLAFNKAAVTELNDNQIAEVNGGATPFLVSFIVSYYIVRDVVAPH
ncbi:MAG TPA: class I lanthipeptide [Flavobacterium sp.]|jgi:hypothetical protein|nr:class I lanthipeptide [Flavobacterium sp.]